ncbi:MAG: NAD(P)/FAD-dependent oxidoreductase [Burkholderiaceae bacterium]|nr:NAD(P)/FAD-dependent oxidoreductase [Burkholderiaceae bacterium]
MQGIPPIFPAAAGLAAPRSYDVLIIGAGFAGLHMLNQTRGMGLSARVFEAAADVGGVWYWNRYPGARCDVESMQYSYSFSSELEQEWVWSEKYAAQPEILRYIQHVADRFDLRRDIQFDTRVESASFDEAAQQWELCTGAGQRVRGRFVVMATGALSIPRLPDVPGIENFAGPIYHTGAWPHEGVDFTGQRVGVIGTGSSGIQAIPAIARQAFQLVVYQRSANFSIPAWNEPLEPAAQNAWKQMYHEYRRRAREVGTLYEFSAKGALQVSEEERQREYERRWDMGGVNLVHAFNDLMLDKRSNDTIADFVRSRIRAIVKDPEVAEALCPKDHALGTKRICVDTGYYETYNRDNVKLVDLKQTPIQQVTSTGVRTAVGFDTLDALVCATGYDALTGAVLKMDVRGRGGLSLRDKWADGPRTYLGLMTGGFPNLFIITGAGSPSVLVNMIVGIEQHVEWIGDCLCYLRQHGIGTIEASKDAEDRWVEHVNAAANKTLFPTANSWFLGANIPGKPRVFMPYVAKIGVYRKECQEIAEKGYEGFLMEPMQHPEPVQFERLA